MTFNRAIKSLLLGAAATIAFAPASHAQFSLPQIEIPDIFGKPKNKEAPNDTNSTTGGSAGPMDLVIAATQVSQACFVPPKSSGGAFDLLDQGRILLEQQNYNNNLSNYPICRLGQNNEPLVLAMAAGLAKFSVVEITKSMLDIEVAFGLKTEELIGFAERLNAMNASEIDYVEVNAFLKAEADKIQAFHKQNKNFQPSDALALQISKAESRLLATYKSTGQAIGAAVWIVDRLGKMSNSQRQSLLAQSLRYGVEGSFLESASSLTIGLAQSLSGTIDAVAKVAEAKRRDVVFSAADRAAAMKVAGAEANKVIDNLSKGGVL
jgi:hypothetical protein